MATTSKTLTATNQTITIPDMTERPNASVLTDGISKDADAINANTAAIANRAKSINLTSSDDSWSAIWTKIDVLSSGESATIYINATPISVISNGARTSQVMGTITRTSSNYFNFLVKDSAFNIIAATLTNASSSSAGTYAETNLSAQIGSLSYKYLNTISANGSKEVSLANDTRATFFVIGSNESRMDIINVFVGSSGAVTAKKFGSSTYITVTTATNKITISNGTSSATYLQALIFNGSAS